MAMPSCVRDPKAGTIIRARRRLRGGIDAPHFRQLAAFVLTCALQFAHRIRAIAPASQGAPKAKAALGFTASPYWIKLPRLPCCVHVARSCRQWLGIVETKGELFATSATRQREVSPAKYPICWQLSRDYHL